MRKLLIVLVSLLALFVGACGGGDDNSSNDAAGTSEEGSSEANDDDTDFSGKGSDDFCDQARVINEDDSFNNQNASPEETRQQAEDVLDAFEKLAEEAPSEIEDDIDLLFSALQPVFQAVVDGKDLSQLTPEEQAEFDKLESPEFQAASDRVNAYIEKVCKIDADEDGDTDGVDNSDQSTEDTTADSTEDTTEDTTGE